MDFPYCRAGDYPARRGLAIEGATHALGMSEFFVGVIVVAVIGNAAEHFGAVVFASYLFGQPMSLIFNAFELMAIGLSVIALSLVSLDGESNWFEGLQLIAVYIILAIVFYFVPVG